MNSPDQGSPPDPYDPPDLPASRGGLPTFDDIPQVLRQVLVVDDNAVFRSFLRALLEGQGFTVHEADNGTTALALALEKRPWLILSDVRMPGDDGFEFCRKVRSHTLIRQTPLLFLSGWDDYKARYQGLELGADDFVSKETPVRELLIRIQLTLKRHMSLGRRGAPGPGMEGQLDVMGAPGVLQVCHLTRLTGVLMVEAGPRWMTIRFREGEIVGATGDGLEGADAVYEFLAWEEGRFHFAPGDQAGERIGPSFAELVLEGCRRLDEAQRASPSGDAGGGPTV
jgi:CheY-like chemotaxis protein